MILLHCGARPTTTRVSLRRFVFIWQIVDLLAPTITAITRPDLYDYMETVVFAREAPHLLTSSA